MKVIITIDDIGLKSNLKINRTLIFTEEFFFGINNQLFKKINKSVLSHVTFNTDDDDHKPVDFNNETISFTCQLIKI